MLKTLGGLGLASVPTPGERWRVTVRDNVLGKTGASLGERWYDGTGSGYFGYAADNGLASLQLGWPASTPVSLDKYFCLDVRFPTQNPVGDNLSHLVNAWESRLGGEIVRVKRIPAGESSGDGAADRSMEVKAAQRDDAPAPQPGKGKSLSQKTDEAIDLLQLAVWAVIIAGAAYFVRGRMS